MAWATRLEKYKIFKKDKITKRALYDPKQSFDIVMGLFPIPVFDDFFQISAEMLLRKSL